MTTTDATKTPAAADRTAAWDALALELRQLLALVESTREVLANVGDPATPDVLAELRVAHERLDESGRAVMPLVGECRRTTYTVLREQNMTYKEMAAAFGLGSDQAIGNVLAGRRAASKRKRQTTTEGADT